MRNPAEVLGTAPQFRAGCSAGTHPLNPCLPISLQTQTGTAYPLPASFTVGWNSGRLGAASLGLAHSVSQAELHTMGKR